VTRAVRGATLPDLTSARTSFGDHEEDPCGSG
jgi:hypothetical protein